MNKLKTDIEGKFPFVLDDLRFQAEGMKKALANLAKGFGDKVILWGLTANATHNLEGAVFINDEIFKFEQSAILTGNLVLKIAETYDENGYKEFPNRADGDKWRHTYVIRKVVMKSYGTLPSSLPADEFLFSEFIKLSEFVDNSGLINSINENTTEISRCNDQIASEYHTRLYEETNFSAVIKKKAFPLGKMNLNIVNETIDMPIPHSDRLEIVSISVVVYDDFGRMSHNLNNIDVSNVITYNYDPDDMVFNIANSGGGGFDGFSSLDYDRGKVVIEYIDRFIVPEH